jgi:hypothetical protein
MRRWPGSTRSALLTVVAAYVVLFADFYFWGLPDGQQVAVLLLSIFIPAIGAAYAIFFFHWLFESGRAGTNYATDYSFAVWLLSSVVSIVYMGIFASFSVLIPYTMTLMPGLFPAAIRSFAVRLIGASDYFEPFLWRSIGMFIVLEIVACTYGKQEGLRYRRRRQEAQ